MSRLAALSLSVAMLSLGGAGAPAAAQENGERTPATSLAERLPPKIHMIQEKLPAWLQKTGNKDAQALMKKLGEQVAAQQFVEAESTADSLLKVMGLTAPDVGPKADSSGRKKTATPVSNSPEDTTRRLTEKVERVTAGAQKWAADGRDPGEILKTMQEKFQPLMVAGKIAEAEAVVDSVLKKLGTDTTAPTATPANAASAEERVLARVHMIQKELPEWRKKTDKQAESDALLLTLKEQLADMNFSEAERTADTILKLMGLSMAAATPAAQPATAAPANQAADPLGAFFPQQLVFLAADRIALTLEQRETLLAKINTTRPRLEQLQVAVQDESAALTKLISQAPLEEAAVLDQLNKYLDVQREAKQLQTVLGVNIQNLLTTEQKAKLREVATTPDAVAKLEEELRNRINSKIARITAGAQALGQSGRDPSFIARAMEEKVRPLIDSGRVFEAETEIDKVLEQLSKDNK